ncbi:hypothetical protein [Ferrigenium sp. UT5]|uniref:hypothetical protein n=1 Tax=Ferrigenium sp. UT5 TaxID=3242105 RepID=UPI003552A83B
MIDEKPQAETLIFAQWADARAEDLHCFRCLEPADAAIFQVLPNAEAARAEAVLAENTSPLLIGDAAVADGTLIGRLAQGAGAGRLGVYVRAGRMPVSWSLDTTSNADFRCVTPSWCKPGWEVLRADGRGTGTDVAWWLQEMFSAGAVRALIQKDIEDEDLDMCATLNLQFPGKLWFEPSAGFSGDLEPWVRYGKVRQLVLPDNGKYPEAEHERLRTVVAALAKEEDVV